MTTKGTESVWDYPRPPRLEQAGRHIRIVHHGVTLAETRAAWRVLETSHPPVYYLPQADLAMERIVRSERRGSFCEWKGSATYWSVVLPDGTRVDDVAWSYANPTRSFAGLKDHLAFYAGMLDLCEVDGEQVTPQPGAFYGGWINSWVTGPFKGAPGTMGW